MDSVIKCDEIIETTKKFQQILMEKSKPVKKEIPYFTCLFIHYHNIIESCEDLLLPDKIENKKKHLFPYHVTNNKLKKVIL